MCVCVFAYVFEELEEEKLSHQLSKPFFLPEQEINVLEGKTHGPTTTDDDDEVFLGS